MRRYEEKVRMVDKLSTVEPPHAWLSMRAPHFCGGVWRRPSHIPLLCPVLPLNANVDAMQMPAATDGGEQELRPQLGVDCVLEKRLHLSDGPGDKLVSNTCKVTIIPDNGRRLRCPFRLEGAVTFRLSHSIEQSDGGSVCWNNPPRELSLGPNILTRISCGGRAQLTPSKMIGYPSRLYPISRLRVVCVGHAGSAG